MKQINKDQIINKIRECIDLSRKDFDFESTKIEIALVEIYKQLIKKELEKKDKNGKYEK